jgi:hypothetical protein
MRALSKRRAELKLQWAVGNSQPRVIADQFTDSAVEAFFSDPCNPRNLRLIQIV